MNLVAFLVRLSLDKSSRTLEPRLGVIKLGFILHVDQGRHFQGGVKLVAVFRQLNAGMVWAERADTSNQGGRDSRASPNSSVDSAFVKPVSLL